MKKTCLFFCAAFLFPHLYYSQTQQEIDALCNTICTSIEKSDAPSDQEKIEEAFEEHIMDFIEFHELTVVEELMDKVYFRLQKVCGTFTTMLTNSNQSLENGDWEIINEKPEIKLSKKEARSFAKENGIYYFETDRKKTFVTIKGGKWIETFSDNTQSILKFKWTGDTTFDLIFIESDNITRKNFSNPGDVYNYTLTSKEDGYYYFTTSLAEGDDRVLISKFHFE